MCVCVCVCFLWGGVGGGGVNTAGPTGVLWGRELRGACRGKSSSSSLLHREAEGEGVQASRVQGASSWVGFEVYGRRATQTHQPSIIFGVGSSYSYPRNAWRGAEDFQVRQSSPFWQFRSLARRRVLRLRGILGTYVSDSPLKKCQVSESAKRIARIRTRYVFSHYVLCSSSLNGTNALRTSEPAALCRAFGSAKLVQLRLHFGVEGLVGQDRAASLLLRRFGRDCCQFAKGSAGPSIVRSRKLGRLSRILTDGDIHCC